MVTQVVICFLAFFYLNSVPFKCVTNAQNVTVTTTKGEILGRQNQTNNGTPYYAFKGIRYAQPPLDDLRFEPPVPVEAWNDTYDATEDKRECMQGVTGEGSEDCLFLSVYTPSMNSSSSLPVLVWIHGGYFMKGDATFDSQDPELLLDEIIVFIEIQYRLGIFGFVSTGDEVLPGNVGHRDQILALKWVQENVQYFGGDKDKVTLGGQSAGGVSASVLTQSPLAKGLFRSAIMESGNSLCLSSRCRRTNETSFKTGLLTGLTSPTGNSELLKQHLKKLDAKALQIASYTAFEVVSAKDPLNGLGLGTVLERCSEDAVFCNNSYDSMSSGNFNQVPMLLGVNSNETSPKGGPKVFFSAFSSRNHFDKKSLASIDMTDNDNDRSAAGAKVKNEYWGPLLPVTVKDTHTMKYISESQFVRPAREFARQASKHVPVYFYEYSYQGDVLGKSDSSYSGAGHGAELDFLFKNEGNVTITARDTLTRRRLARMWANFVKYSNPTPEEESLLQNVTWIPATASNNLTYLNIGDDLVLEENISEESMQFWDDLYEEYGTGSYDTY